jgi:hypothetical protein
MVLSNRRLGEGGLLEVFSAEDGKTNLVSLAVA